MKNIKGQLPVFISKKLEYLSKKMVDEFDAGDVESALRTSHIRESVLRGYEQFHPVGVTVCNGNGDSVTVLRKAE